MDRVKVAILVALVGLPVMVVGAAFILGSMVEGLAEYRTQHDQCLKRADSGYAIERCQR